MERWACLSANTLSKCTQTNYMKQYCVLFVWLVLQLRTCIWSLVSYMSVDLGFLKRILVSLCVVATLQKKPSHWITRVCLDANESRNFMQWSQQVTQSNIYRGCWIVNSDCKRHKHLAQQHSHAHYLPPTHHLEFSSWILHEFHELYLLAWVPKHHK